MVNGFRVATYNIHKCKGLDQRIRPERIVEVLKEIDADIVALQEVLSAGKAESREDQAGFIARSLGLDFRIGENRRLRGGAYGNVVISRFPLIESRNHDISVRGREQRGCLRVDLNIGGGQALHVYNIHMGTSYIERRRQARMLFKGEVLENDDLTGPRILMGDFNEWTRGLTSKLLSGHFQSVDVRAHLRRSRTYPGVLPFLHLDHIYFDESLTMEKATLHRSRAALIASDHLPVVADLKLKVLSPE